MDDTRDSLDFAHTDVSRLFVKLFFPTLLGMLSGALFNLADGIFVGRGVGADALAAINIAAPVFLVCSALSLLLGSGVSVVAAIHLAKGNDKAARICVTQALSVAVVLLAGITAVELLFPHALAMALGGSEHLFPLVKTYMYHCAPCLLASGVMFLGLFVLRLDGSPRYAMYVEVSGSLLNIVLDYVAVFVLHTGLRGAAIASSVSCCLGAAAIVYYMLRRAQRLTLYRPKFSATALRLTARNVGYIMQMGFATGLGDLAVAFTMAVGNFAFMHRLGEAGVAAYSVACYLYPLIFMLGSAIAQAALPIVSYSVGCGRWGRVARAFRLSLKMAVGCGMALSVVGLTCSPLIASLFLNGGDAAYALAVKGFPLYATSFFFFTLNIVLISYLQSIKRAGLSTFFMFIRGFVLLLPCYVVLPAVAHDNGLWLALPASEALTTLWLALYLLTHRSALYLKA